MSDKELVIDTIQKMPDHFTLVEILEELKILDEIRRAELNAGDPVPHDEVKRRVAAWLSGHGLESDSCTIVRQNSLDSRQR